MSKESQQYSSFGSSRNQLHLSVRPDDTDTPTVMQLKTWSATPSSCNNQDETNLSSINCKSSAIQTGSQSVPPVAHRNRNKFTFHNVLPKTSTSASTPTTPTGRDNSNFGGLEHLIQCPICMDRLNEPKMLPCQHTFCLICLETMHKSNISHKYLICPICKNKTDLVNGLSPLSLPTNLYIDSVIKLLGNATSTIQTTKKTDIERCIKCQSINSFDQIKSKKCRHCDQIFCSICWESHMHDLSEQIHLLDQRLNTAQEKLDYRLDNFKDGCEKLNYHINTFIENKISALKDKQNALLAESDTILNRYFASYDIIHDRIDIIRNKIKDCVANPVVDKVSSFQTLHKDTSDIFSEINQWDEIRIVFHPKEYSIETTQTNQATSDAAELLIDDETNENPISPAALTKSNLWDNIDNLTEFYKKKHFKTKLIWTKCSRPTGVCVAPWTYGDTVEKLLYIAGSDSRIVYGIEMHKGRILQRITHNDMIFPHGITISSERKEIFISDKWKHCIFVFSKEGEILRTIGSKGDLGGYLRSPEGIVVTSNIIYVCDTGNDRIQGLNIYDGRMIMQFGLIKREQMIAASKCKVIATISDLNSPTGIALHDDTIVVLDSGNKRVKVFNKNGEKLFEFGQLGSMKGHFKYPEVIAVDPLGFILVGDSGNSRIQIFKPTGQLVTTIGSRGNSPGKFEWISGIHVTNDLEIIVTDYKTHTVQVFH